MKDISPPQVSLLFVKWDDGSPFAGVWFGLKLTCVKRLPGSLKIQDSLLTESYSSLLHQL